MKYEDIKAKFPDASSVGGEIVARVNGESVVVGTYANGSFSLTKKGEDTPTEEKAPKSPRKGGKAAKEVVPANDEVILPGGGEVVPTEPGSIDAILGE